MKRTKAEIKWSRAELAHASPHRSFQDPDRALRRKVLEMNDKTRRGCQA